MAQIAIEKSTFERLQRHAIPLEDTPDTVVNRALDALERDESSSAPSWEQPVPEHPIDPANLPSLKHTGVLAARLNGRSVAKLKWNGILDEVVIHGMKRIRHFEEFRRRCPARMVSGRKEDEGYRYLAEADISIQGRSATEVGKMLVEAAGNLDIELDIVFQWKQGKDSAHPGKRGRLYLPATRRHGGGS